MINALSDCSHPCQAMADLMTIEELKGPLAGRKLVFVGDGNNVARSLAVASALLGVNYVLAAPPGYEFPPAFSARFADRFPQVPLRGRARFRARPSPGPTSFTPTSGRAWDRNRKPTSARDVFAPYQVNDELAGTRRSRGPSSCTACRLIAARR